VTGKQKKYLRGLAHHLKPVVQVGGKGLTKAVLEQISEQLRIHELIKVKLSQEVPVSKKDAGQAATKACDADLVQILGRNLVFYRPRDEEPTIRLPRVSPVVEAV
jgi:RNA-binding protein